MKIGLTIFGMNNPSMQFWVKFALDMGFNHLEFSEDVFPLANEISQLMINRDVQGAIHAPYPYDYGYDLSSPPPRQKKASSFIHHVNKLTEKLHLSYVIIHPPDDPQANRDIFLENLSRLKPIPLLENLFGSEGHASWQDFAVFFQDTGQSLSRKVGFCFDISHSYISYGSKFLELPSILIEELASTHGYLHVHDGTRTEDLHKPLGQGEIPWNQVFNFLRKIGFKGSLLLELIDKGEWTPKGHVKGVIDSYLKVLEILPQSKHKALVIEMDKKQPLIQQYLEQL